MVPPEGCICKFTVHGSTYTRTSHEDCKAKHSILEWKETVLDKQSELDTECRGYDTPPAKQKLSPAQQQAWDWLEKNKKDPGWIGWPTA